MSELSDRIEAVVKQLEEKLPDCRCSQGGVPPGRRRRSHAAHRARGLRGRSSHMREGYVVDPFAQSKTMNDLRELLVLCRDVIIPYEMKRQIANLRAVGEMAKRT